MVLKQGYISPGLLKEMEARLGDLNQSAIEKFNERHPPKEEKVEEAQRNRADHDLAA